MRIIRPYGRSHVEDDGDGRRRRRLEPHSPPAPPNSRRDIAEFAASNDELIIAQWISAIDKIAAKPAGKNGATEEQREFRKELGNAAWKHLWDKRLLSGLGTSVETLEKIWRFKIAPYGEQKYRPKKDKKGIELQPRVKGRWFERFAGDCEVGKADVEAIVKKIHEHLHNNEYGGRDKTRAKGRIDARAVSIADNVWLRPKPKEGAAAKPARPLSISEKMLRSESAAGAGAEPAWADGDLQIYKQAGNVAEEIRKAAKRREDGEDDTGTTRVTNSVAGAVLFDLWPKLFWDSERAAALTVAEARSRKPGLFALHMAVKEFYARRLKHHKKKALTERQKEKTPDQDSAILTVLPRSMDELFRLIDAGRANRELGALVRLGKVIHYQASAGRPDNPANIAEHWPADIAQSRYLTSAGQTEIKRNEAFVRVWRHALALASRTLKDWADPGNQINNDILLSAKTVLDERPFNSDAFTKKCRLLFGKYAGNDYPDVFHTNDERLQKALLGTALLGTAQLRHKSFHFTGLGRFVAVLTELRQLDELKRSKSAQTSEWDKVSALQGGRFADVLKALHGLWREDVLGQGAQLRAAMVAARFGDYLEKAQIETFYQLVTEAEIATLPLPRFNRLLQRADDAWVIRRDGIVVERLLPEPANMRDLEESARRLCQYTALKRLYERPFRKWLEARDAATLNRFIDRAIERATEAARNLNTQDEEWRRDITRARADSLGRLSEGGGLQSFFFRLSAETASEMRVQRGYESDADKAREKAAYIEKLKCDLVALAFDAYLNSKNLDVLLRPLQEQPIPEASRFDVAGLRDPKVDTAAADWQAVLYFLVHLVPVEEIGRLLHQMHKWKVLAGKAREDEAGAKPDAPSADARSPSDGSSAAPPPAAASDDPVREVLRVLELYLDMHDAKFEGGAALIGTDAFKGLYESEAAFSLMFPHQPAGAEHQPAAAADRRIPRRGLREIMRFGALGSLISLFSAGGKITAHDVRRYLQAEETEGGKRSAIAQRQRDREALHEEWAALHDKKETNKFDGEKRRAYVEALGAVIRHRHLAARVTLTNPVRLHRLMMAVLGRLVDFSGLWERDLYFVTLALLYRKGLHPRQAFDGDGLETLKGGGIIAAVRKLKQAGRHGEVVESLKRRFGLEQPSVKVRNGLAHFNMLEGAAPPDLTHWVNQTRMLVSHDRKLKNAVSQAVTELLAREGLGIAWTMNASRQPHRLVGAKLQARQASHLGRAKLFKHGDPEKSWAGKPIEESLHGDDFVGAVAKLFGGRLIDGRGCVSRLDLGEIDWQRLSWKRM